ncbi:hypothetical protein E3E26_06925 [Thermococcus sp. LS1]|uniref:hypothetical protein n=1 Tax=Thermococcus sp. LS1 TaxID=1638259 RepID=UPI0014391D3A|nr:hypothetical protein [Thermococcus sp. LS1]NJD99516.1 hypothetical protein [Thermococcus sp. LS1]
MDNDRSIWAKVFSISLLVLTALFGGFVLRSYLISDVNGIQFAVAMANILVAIFVALQTMATREAVEQTSEQVKLTRQTLIEMKKQRMNIEFIKNSLIGYLKEEIMRELVNNSRANRNYKPLHNSLFFVKTNYQKRHGNQTLAPDELGMINKTASKIEKFLEKWGIDIREYNSLISEYEQLERIRDTKNSMEKAKEIREKSQELLEKVNRILDMSDEELEEELLKL